MANRFSVEAVFKAVDRITAPVTRMQNRIGKMTRSIRAGLKNVNRTMSKVTAGFKKIAAVSVVSIGAMGFAMADVVRTGAEFEQAITNVGAVSLRTRAQIEPLEKLALELGRTTRFTSTQAANAMEVLAKAGFKTNEILEATPAILSAAAASGLEIAEVADHVSNALKGMGLETSQAAMVADVLTLASSRTNSSIGSLGESIRNVASTARQLNIPITEVTAAVALLQDVGLDASVAGSAFNTMLTKMAAPTASIQKQMKKFGITFKDAKGNMLPFQKVLQQLGVASKKAGGNFDKVAFLAELVGLRGQKAASNLAVLFESGKFTELTEELENAAGAAEKMANIRMNTVQGSLLLLGSAVDAVKVKIFGLNEGPLKGVIDNITQWISANEELIASEIGSFINDLITNLPLIAQSLADIFTGVGAVLALVIALKALAAIMTIVNLVMAANPIVLIILAAVAAVGLLLIAFTSIGDTIKSIFSGIGRLFSGISSLKGIFGGGADEDIVEGAGQLAGVTPQVVTPQERTARQIEEQRTTNTSEVTITDQTGRAEVAGGGALPAGVKLQSSGAF